MQREIEALLVAYLSDRNKETQMIQDLLTALAVGAAARQLMVRDLALAIGAQAPIAQGSAMTKAGVEAPPAGNDISSAIAHLRTARGPSASTH